MIFSKANAIKAVIHLATIIGLFMSLFYNFGYSVDKDKEKFLKIINEKLEETNGQFNRTAKASSGE